MLTALAALAMAQLPKFDGESAIARATGILREAGITDNLELNSLTDKSWITKDPCWSVSFLTPRGELWIVLDGRNGRPIHFQTLTQEKLPQASNQAPTPESLATCDELMKTLGYPNPGPRGTDVGFEAGACSAEYNVLVNGHPFFNLNPRYQNRIAYHPRTKALYSFQTCPTPPPVNAAIPRFDPNFAVAQIRAWARKRAEKKGLPAIVDPSRGELVPELGYWKFAQEPDARLVWRAAKYTKIQGLRYGLGAIRMFVDAQTGRLVEPDDPAWSPY